MEQRRLLPIKHKCRGENKSNDNANDRHTRQLFQFIQTIDQLHLTQLIDRSKARCRRGIAMVCASVNKNRMKDVMQCPESNGLVACDLLKLGSIDSKEQKVLK